MPMIRMSRYWRSTSDSRHVAHPAEQLNRLVRDPFAGLDGSVLGEAHLGDQIGFARELSFDQVVRVHPSDVNAPGHFRQRVLDLLAGNQWPAEGFAVAAPIHGQVEAALRAGIRLGGHADAFGHERPGDLYEAGVLGADEVGRRHPYVRVGQLSGVRGPPAHLVQLARDLEPWRFLVDDDQRNARRSRASRAHRGHHIVGPHTGCDVGLGAVDDVVVAVANRACGQVPDVRTAAGFGDRQAADQLTAQRGPHVGVDQPLVAGRDHVRHRDAAREQRCPNPARGTGVVHFLADDHRVGAVAAATADRLGQAGAEQTGLTGLAVKLARQVADALPLVDVRQHFAFGERAHRLSQLLALGCVPDVHYRRLLRDVFAQLDRYVDGPAAQPLAQPLGLWVEPRLIRDALSEDAVDDEVDRPQVRQHMAGDGQIGCLGQQFAQLSTVSVCASQRHCASVRTHTPDVRAATLVAAARAGDQAEWHPPRLTERQRLGQTRRVERAPIPASGSPGQSPSGCHRRARRRAALRWRRRSPA